MPTLNWIGKESVINHDKEVSFRLLKKVKAHSVGTNSQNLIIHGDNLEALKALMPYYMNKIKCIYIDPPYNTGNENWVYNDKVNSPKIKKWLGKVVGRESEDLCRHDKWLCMMYPRLKLLRDLLSEDGVIFISIDENELSNLKILMNEIFDEKNNVATFSWVRKKKGSFLSKKIRKMTEFVLCYQKKENNMSFFGEEAYLEKWQPIVKRTNTEKELIFPKDFVEVNLIDGVYKAGKYGDSNTGIYFLNDFTARDGKIITSLKTKARYVWTQDFLNKEIAMGTRVSLSSKFGFNVLRYNQSEKTKTPSTLINQDNGVGTNEDASNELAELFSREIGTIFDYPKPVSLVKYLLNMISKDEKDIWVLDSFAGSGTTGHAVLDLNKEDGGNRKFILVELEDNIAKDITTKRIAKAIDKYEYKDGFEYCELDKPLFDENGKIDEECSFEQLATYIYFIESNTNLDKKNISKNYIGNYNNIEYYLLYKEKGKNILTKDFLKNINSNKTKKIIYADKCLVDEKNLIKHNIIFKQIPYEIKVF